MLDQQAELFEAISKGKVEIVFKKVDGSVRTLIGTINKDIIAKAGWTPKLKEGESKPKPAGVVPVFCTETNIWKSFKLENLISFKQLASASEPKLDSEVKKNG